MRNARKRIQTFKKIIKNGEGKEKKGGKMKFEGVKGCCEERRGEGDGKKNGFLYNNIM